MNLNPYEQECLLVDHIVNSIPEGVKDDPLFVCNAMLRAMWRFGAHAIILATVDDVEEEVLQYDDAEDLYYKVNEDYPDSSNKLEAAMVLAYLQREDLPEDFWVKAACSGAAPSVYPDGDDWVVNSSMHQITMNIYKHALKEIENAK